MTQLVRQDAAAKIAIQIVLDSLDSPHSRRAYERHLREFLVWTGGGTINKALVQRYTSQLREAGASSASINQKLSAIRKLAAEAADNGVLEHQIAVGIQAIKGMRQEGRRTGNWLSKEQVITLLGRPDTSTLKGLRDRALFAVLIGCGLRRAEAANLIFSHIQQREGRWVLVDLIGKRNKIRSVPMPNWSKVAIDAYAIEAGLISGFVFRPINKGGRMSGEKITEAGIYSIVLEYADVLGFGFAPHDLRRSFAKLAYKGGSGLDQIQLSLGHGSIQTTERYLGVEQDLTDAPCDRLGLRLG